MSSEDNLLWELHREVTAIAEYVAELRLAIDSLRAPELADERLPDLRNDLSVVHDATRDAAHRILDTAEDLLAKASAGELDAAYIEGRMMELMEACSFQDLNGQRLRRTQDMLNAIEDRLSSFVERAGAGSDSLDGVDAEAKLESRNKARMANGPSSNPLAQSDIDQLLNSA